VTDTPNNSNPAPRPTMIGRARSFLSRFSRKKAELAIDLSDMQSQGEARGKNEPLLKPMKRQASSAINQHGLLGVIGNGVFDTDRYGFNSFLSEIGRFNPVYVEPFFQILMRRSPMPRIALIILSSALTERQYVVEGASPEVEKFHQDWIDKVMPQILQRASNAIWFGWQPFVIDWGVDDDGNLLPMKFNDVDPFSTQAIEQEDTKAFSGLRTEGATFGLDRSFKLTWEGNYNNHYGEGQALTCYSSWWSASVLNVWMCRYFERSVDPVRIAFAKNISVPTGTVDGAGAPVHVDLTELVAEALDAAQGGASTAFPIGEDDEELVKIETLEMPDRSDTFLKAIAFYEQKQLLSTLGMPGIGISGTGGDVAVDARVAEKLQIRVLEHASNMPVDAMNEYLIAMVHKANKLPGPVPTLKGKAFKREQQETLLELFKAGMAQPLPEIGENGPTGKSYRLEDLIQWDKVGKSLDLAMHDIAEVARKAEEMEEQAPGKGGRPKEPLNEVDVKSGNNVTRSEARAAGRDR